MAHMIETMAYAGETPWHGLGKRVLNDLTPAQMLKEAQLDWTVEKRPLFFINYDGGAKMSDSSALVRSSDESVLSVVSNDWNPVQNEEAFEFFHDFVMEGDMEMHTAGSIKDGKNVWALAKVRDGFEILGGDSVESYLLFSNPHEYGKCIDIRFTPIRVVCNNTLTLALGSRSDLMVRLNHRRSFDAGMVKQTLGIAQTKMSSYKEMAEFLASREYNDKSVVEYLKEVFPSASKKEEKLSRPAQTAFSVLETQPGNEFGKNSWWQAFNAVTYSTDHLLGQSQETRLQSSWYGVNRQKKIAALEKAVEYAEAA